MWTTAPPIVLNANGRQLWAGQSQTARPGGEHRPAERSATLLKILLTNCCIDDCQYCINRVTSDTPRARFTIDEVVRLTMDSYKRNYIERLFLSSGIIQNSDYTMQQMIAIPKRLRQEHRFGGCIHLETIPNANAALIAGAGLWADRLSVNIESPTAPDLQKLAPEKSQPQIIEAMGGQLGPAIAALWPGRCSKRNHWGRGTGAPMADLLYRHLQPDAGQDSGDEAGNAGSPLADTAQSGADRHAAAPSR